MNLKQKKILNYGKKILILDRLLKINNILYLIIIFKFFYKRYLIKKSINTYKITINQNC